MKAALIALSLLFATFSADDFNPNEIKQQVGTFA